MLLTNQTTQDYFFGPLHLAAGVGSTLTVDDTTATSLYLTDDTVADAINTLVASSKVTQTGAAAPFPRPTGVPEVLHGDGSPEGLVYGGQGSLYLRRDNSGGTQLYQKTTGIHLNTGWVSTAGTAIAPTGTVTQYAGPTAPSGYLLCDGSAVSRTTYSDLFAICGTLYGAGDGSTTFNVPDLRGRAPVGYAASGGHTDVSTLGLSESLVVANRRPKHRTTNSLTVSDSGHTHPSTPVSTTAGSPNYSGPWGSADRNTTTLTPSGSYANTGSGTAAVSLGGSIGTNNANDPIDTAAYLVINHIIKT